ncbi:hypothetical protein NOVOSPHI9U_580021 [Novosphingobium sp. 9U]|nr:hypothetical protein NOVOSPHI9U_580021 [Novosphingobium sp. 9U]
MYAPGIDLPYSRQKSREISFRPSRGAYFGNTTLIHADEDYLAARLVHPKLIPRDVKSIFEWIPCA